MEFAVLPPPGPDRAFEVCAVDHDAAEAELSDGIMCRAHLEQHLVISPEVDCLDVAPGPQIPEVDSMAILVRK